MNVGVLVAPFLRLLRPPGSPEARVSGIYITDYIDEPDIEQAILGSRLRSQLDDDVSVLLVWHQKIDDALLSRWPQLSGIVRYGVGVDGVDLDAATRRGVVVCNTPDYGTEEVSDTALAFAMNATRGIARYDAQARRDRGTWQEATLPDLRRTSTRTLGVVGAGRIGGSVLLKARGLRFDTAFYDPYLARGQEKLLGAQRVESLEALLAASDIVSLHTPLNDETRGMVDRDFIEAMRPGAILINTARGGLIPDLDLVHWALRSGRLSQIALDVLPEEPPSAHPLIDAWRSREPWLEGRLIINPHTAYYSQEAFREMRQKASENALRIVSGRCPWNVVNTAGAPSRVLRPETGSTAWVSA